jgi:hypothetical protein
VYCYFFLFFLLTLDIKCVVRFRWRRASCALHCVASIALRCIVGVGKIVVGGGEKDT